MLSSWMLARNKYLHAHWVLSGKLIAFACFWAGVVLSCRLGSHTSSVGIITVRVSTLPDFLVSAAMLLLSSKCDFLSLGFGVRKLRRCRFALSRSVLTFRKNRKKKKSFLRFEVKLQISGTHGFEYNDACAKMSAWYRISLSESSERSIKTL